MSASPEHTANPPQATADDVERGVMEYDIVTVRAGPAGLSFAIRL